MSKIALIPARYASTRFPAKLMQPLGNDTVIHTTYLAVVNTQLFDEVYVVTDSEIIFEEITQKGGKALMSSPQHECGTDRIAEAAAILPHAEIIVNIQGDEPFTAKEPLQLLLNAFEGIEGENVQAASLMQILKDKNAVENPNNVKVIIDNNDYALYFSRAVIPFVRDENDADQVHFYKHIGIYAFRREMLVAFAQLPIGKLEQAEKLEGLRFLENGYKLKMILTDYTTIGIDTPEDLEIAIKRLAQ